MMMAPLRNDAPSKRLCGIPPQRGDVAVKSFSVLAVFFEGSTRTRTRDAACIGRGKWTAGRPSFVCPLSGEAARVVHRGPHRHRNLRTKWRDSSLAFVCVQWRPTRGSSVSFPKSE